MSCNGSEPRLLSCPHSGPGVENCSHDEEAGVRCQGNTYIVCALQIIFHASVTIRTIITVYEVVQLSFIKL